jgi:hypothetical protein
VAAVGLFVLAAAVAGAEPPDARSGVGPPEPPEPWNTRWDWIQLTSGEWLKGEFEWLRDRTVSFDSDELERLEFDWEDIARFHLARPHYYRFESEQLGNRRDVYRGPGEMRDGMVRVWTDAGTVEFDRKELVNIVEGAGRERDLWSSKVSLGVAVRQGNTDQADFSGTAGLTRESALTRWSVDYTGVISSVNEERNANNHRATTTFDVFVTRRFYVTVPFFEYFTDEFQNIESRFTPGAAVGYELMRRLWIEWDATLGAGYQRTDFTTAGVGPSNDAAALLGTELNFDFRAFDWDNLFRIQLIPTDLGKSNSHLQSVLSFDIWGPLDLDLSFIWDRIQDPEPDASGQTPERDDFRMTVGLGLDF